MKSFAALRQAVAHHAPFRIPATPQLQQRCCHLAARPKASPSVLRKQYPTTRIANQLQQLRRESTERDPHPLTERDEPNQESVQERADRQAQEPAYEMTFTCRKCLTRSSHRITKQAYHFGTTLITCPGCKNRHLISDHLKIFSDKNMTIEDLLKEKGEFLKKGRLGEDGDIEFYDDAAGAKAP